MASTASPVELKPETGAPSPAANASSPPAIESKGPASATDSCGAPLPGASAAGPTSRTWSIPPRPKPGRKPKSDTPDESRKLQNRLAQKKFRATQATKLKDLQVEHEKVKHDKTSTDRIVSDLQHRNAQLLQEMQAMKRDLDALRAENKRQAEQLEYESAAKRMRFVASSHQGPIRTTFSNATNNPSVPVNLATTSQPTPGSHPTPPEDPPEEMEIDFTNSGIGTNSMGVTDDCGFCADADFCACRAAATELPKPAEQSPTMTRRGSSDNGNKKPTEPGTCDMCQADPEQARKCRELAATSFSPVPPPTSAARPSLPPISALTSCADFLAKVKPKTDDEYKRILRGLHAYPYTDRPGHMGGAHRPAMDIDAKEAAVALTSLSQQPAKN